MSDHLEEIAQMVGVEFLLVSDRSVCQKETYSTEEKIIYPDFDHVTNLS